MNNYALINKLYNPSKITRIGKCLIFECEEGKYVAKKKSEDENPELYKYLKNRNFDGFPKMVDQSRIGMNIYEYIEDNYLPYEQKGEELIELVSLLHNNTAYEREVTEDSFKDIYDDIKNNILYYRDKYSKYINDIEQEIYMSPSHYLFIRNSSKILNALTFCENKLDEWYENVKNNKTSKVCIIHNNLCIDHYKNNGDSYLISWDNAKRDSPILDIYKLYKKEALKLNFESLFKKYFDNTNISDEDRDLLFIMICIPDDIFFSDNEFESCELIERSLDYLFKTESLVRPYYTSQDEKQ